jgi:hypothetical protein
MPSSRALDCMCRGSEILHVLLQVFDKAYLEVNLTLRLDSADMAIQRY